MPVMPICRQPIIDHRGGTIVSLHVTALTREDGTGVRAPWPYGAPPVGPDALRLTGALTAQVGADGTAEVRTLVAQDLAPAIVERPAGTLERELHRVFVPAATQGPTAVHAALLLAVEEWNGTTRDAVAQDVIDELAPTLADAVGTTVRARLKDDEPQGLTGGAVLGGSVAGLRDTLASWPREDFALVQTSLLVPAGADAGALAQELLVTGPAQDTYRLRVEWRIRHLPVADDVLHLQVHYGDFVVAEAGGRQTLVANRPRPSDWETFGLVRLGGDRVALIAPNGDYVSAAGGGGREVLAVGDRIGEWETFRVEEVMVDRIALRAFNGHYVSAYHGGGRELVANRPVRDEYEVFTLHRP